MPRGSGEKLTQKNQSLEKGLAIMEYLAECPEPIRLQDLAEGLQMSASTVLRFLTTLMRAGYVEQDEESARYYLTLKVCALAGKVSQRDSLAAIARPHMRALSRKCAESVCLAVEKDQSIVYVAVVDGPDKVLKSLQRIGNRAPLYCTGIGKLLLLNKTEKQVDALLKRSRPVTFTKNTIVTKSALLEELSRVREADMAFDNEECELGVRCVAMPIRDYTGKIVAGLSITGTVFRLTDEFVEERRADIRAAADRISKALGYEG